MKIKYNGEIHETEVNDKGVIVSKVGNIFFGFEGQPLLKGEEYVEPVEEVISDDTI